MHIYSKGMFYGYRFTAWFLAFRPFVITNVVACDKFNNYPVIPVVANMRVHARRDLHKFPTLQL